MAIAFWIIISILIITPYVVFQLSKKSKDAIWVNWGMDWVSLLATVFGGVALGQLMSQTMTTESYSHWMWLIVAPFLLVAILMLILPRSAMKDIMKPGISVDERVATISSKSARNALMVTYLGLLILLIIDQDPIDRNLLMILPGSGLVVFYASYFYYYYARS